MSPQMTYASVLPGKMGKHKNHIFHSKQFDCVARTVHQCTVFLKDKLSCVMFDKRLHLLR